jgi:serine/threonine-protein phosphatase CPPED1
MKVDKNEETRRAFLRSAAWRITALAVPLRGSLAGEPSRGTFTFVQLCDTQLGFGGYEHDVNTLKQAVKQINALAPDFVVICGDLVNHPDETAFADFKKIKAELTVPCYCACGNHDVGGKPTPESLQYYRKVIGKDYYSLEHNGYVFVIVNTQLWKALVEGESQRHESWLKATLETAAQKGSPIFVIGHYPLFLKEPNEAEEYMNLPPAIRKALLSLFEKRGVVAVLGGHTHRLLINDYKGMQLVNGETTSKNFDKRPLGFRVWHVMSGKPPKHEFVSLGGF